MANKTWFGGSGSFATAADWTPAGVPQAGDLAFIGTGAVGATGLDLTGVTIHLGHYQPTGAPTLTLRHTTVGDIQLGNDAPVPDAGGAQHIVIAKTASIAGLVAPSFELQGTAGIALNQGARLINAGTITTAGAGLSSVIAVTGGAYAQVVNDGLVQVEAGRVSIDVGVVGTGTMELLGAGNGLEINSVLALGGTVGNAQTVAFGAAPASPATNELQLADPAGFHATITGFAGSDRIELVGVDATSTAFAGGVLRVSDAGGAIARLHFAGSYGASDFTLTHDGGNSFIGLAG